METNTKYNFKIAICADKASENERLKRECYHLGYVDITSFPDGESLLNSPELSSINLVFLDIEMPHLNGLDIKEKLAQKFSSILVVIVSSHPELMPDAFGRNVISFLKKPFSKTTLSLCLQKATRLSLDFQIIKIDTAHFVLCKDIVYLRSEDKYSVIYLKGKDPILSRISLKDWYTKLESLGFCFTSRNTLVNLKHTHVGEKKTRILSDEVPLTISRNYIDSFYQNYEYYQKTRL